MGVRQRDRACERQYPQYTKSMAKSRCSRAWLAARRSLRFVFLLYSSLTQDSSFSVSRTRSRYISADSFGIQVLRNSPGNPPVPAHSPLSSNNHRSRVQVADVQPEETTITASIYPCQWLLYSPSLMPSTGCNIFWSPAKLQ
jgi:hypothetical protein